MYTYLLRMWITMGHKAQTNADKFPFISLDLFGGISVEKDSTIGLRNLPHSCAVSLRLLDGEDVELSWISQWLV